MAEIEKRLLANGPALRYERASDIDGLPQGEDACWPCSFWLVDTYVLMGGRDEAVTLFERLLKCCHDVGLLSEEYDPHVRRMLDNFPQGFGHVALVNSALGLLLPPRSA